MKTKAIAIAILLVSLLSTLPAFGQGGTATVVRLGPALPSGAKQWQMFILTQTSGGLPPGPYLCVNNPTCTSNSHWSGMGTTSAPGSPGQLILNIAGLLGAKADIYVDANDFLNALGLNINGTGNFSLSGAYALVTDCTPVSSQSEICFGLGGAIEGSENGDAMAQFGRKGLITGAFLKLDGNNCLALGTNGDIGPCRLNTGVTMDLDPANPLLPTKHIFMKDFTSTNVWEGLSCGLDTVDNVYVCGSDHGSSGGSNFPFYMTAGGGTNPFWGVVGQGNFVCHTKNPNCDLGSITLAQQVRIEWMNQFLALNGAGIGPMYLVDTTTGVQIGLAAKRTSDNPSKVVLPATTDTNGVLGAVIGLTNGSVTGGTIVAGGSAYVSPTCQISPPSGNTGVTGLCTVHQTAGVIDSITISNPTGNNGYQFLPTITISDSAGSGAQIIPVVTAKTGSAIIAANGSLVGGIFDGAVTIRDRVRLSTTTAGQFSDSGIPCGAAIPQGSQTFGCLNQTGSGSGMTWQFGVHMHDQEAAMLIDVAPSATSCPTGATIGNTCKDTISLSPAMSSANYIANCQITGVTSGVPLIQGELTADFSAGSFKIQVSAGSAAAAQASTYRCRISQ